MDSPSTLPSLAMSRSTAGFTMSVLAPFYARPEWIGQIPSTAHRFDIRSFDANSKFRIKEKLRSGEMVIHGDQWPIFLYAGYEYDSEDPWKGLFRNSVLVSVGFVQIIARTLPLSMFIT